MQKAWDALLSDWMELLSGCLRVWEADQLTGLLSSPGEDMPPHTALVTMFEAGDYRSLVTATQQSLSEAFAVTEDFRQVGKGWFAWVYVKQTLLQQHEHVLQPALVHHHMSTWCS